MEQQPLPMVKAANCYQKHEDKTEWLAQAELYNSRNDGENNNTLGCHQGAAPKMLDTGSQVAASRKCQQQLSVKHTQEIYCHRSQTATLS